MSNSTEVVFKIYNMLGQEIRYLLNEHQTAGHKSITWDGKDDRGNRVSSDVYIYRLQTGGNVQSKQMLLLK